MVGSVTGVSFEVMAGDDDEYVTHNIINKDDFHSIHDGESNGIFILVGGQGNKESNPKGKFRRKE